MVNAHQGIGIIHFQDNVEASEVISFVILDENAKPQVFLDQHPNTLSQALYLKRVIVLVPSCWVNLIWVSMPNLSANQIKQALPFALEEELVDEFSHCHVVPISKNENQVQVAVIEKAKMQFVMDFFSKWAIEPEVVLPFCLTLPKEEGVATIYIDQNQLVFGADQHSGFGLLSDISQMPDLIKWILESHPEIKKYQILENEKINPSMQPQINTILSSSEWHRISDLNLLEKIANQINEDVLKNNLLSGDFKKTEEKFKFFSMKNKTPLLIISAIVLSFVIPLISYATLSWKLGSVERQILDVQHQVFPKSKSGIKKTRALFENEIKQLQDQQGHDPCWQLLGNVAQAWQADFQLSELVCQNSQLQLKAEFLNADQLNQFSRQLIQQGLSVHSSNTELLASSVKAQIQVSEVNS